MLRARSGLHVSEPAQYVVQIGDKHQQHQYDDTNILGTYHERLARFTACHHLIEEEKHVSAVERGDGKDVHKGKYDAQERRHEPERMPVPYRREEASYGTETAERLRSVCREDILHVAHIAGEISPSVLHTGREALKEAVRYVCRFVISVH